MAEETFPLVGYVLLFTAIPVGFIFVHLVLGKLIRPLRPHTEKGTVYECGEPTIGSAWVQFDLRYYVVALLFVIFDVEVAFFFPWAIVFGQANDIARQDTVPETIEERQAYVQNLKEIAPANSQSTTIPPEPDTLKPYHMHNYAERARDFSLVALIDILVFFGVLLLGFAYLWKRGDLAWVKSTISEAIPPPPPETSVEPAPPPPSAAARELVLPAAH